jgi:hypothetical protein
MPDIKNTRIYNIASLFLEHPSLIFKLDESSNDRYFHIYFSIKGFFDNYLFPNGYSGWPAFLENIIQYYYEEAWGLSISDRIMSGYGAAFFELGFMGLIIPIAITSSIYKCFKNDKKRMWLYSLYINTILFSAIQIALPIIGFMIGYLLYSYDLKKTMISGGTEIYN